MTEFYDIEGYVFAFRVWATMEEALTLQRYLRLFKKFPQPPAPM
jgi:hypothetical protein